MCAGQPWLLAAASVAPDWNKVRSVMPALSPGGTVCGTPSPWALACTVSWYGVRARGMPGR